MLEPLLPLTPALSVIAVILFIAALVLARKIQKKSSVTS